MKTVPGHAGRTRPGLPLVLVALLVIMALAAAVSMQVVSSAGDRLVSNYNQSNSDERTINEGTPLRGQAFTTGSSRGGYTLSEIIAHFDNMTRTHKFDLHTAVHEVRNGNKLGDKVVDMSGSLRKRAKNTWTPDNPTVLEPNTKYMILWRCDIGERDDRCNGRGEKLEVRFTNSNNEDGGGQSGWSIDNRAYYRNSRGTEGTDDKPARIEVKGYPMAHIVSGGVRMYEVNAFEAGGWPVRQPSDDTYGLGEMIAVEVEFSEAVWASSEATFKVWIGSRLRGLATVSNRGTTVIFAALIRSGDRDTDGVWIGDQSVTLAHNPAEYFRTTSGGRDVNLDHGQLGTQRNHKVNGNAVRPAVNSIRITSSPQHRDAYVRGEAVEVRARFSQPVVVSGNVQSRLRVEALGVEANRYADYLSGSGSTELVMQYHVSLLDNDSNGIAIPANALAADGDVSKGARGGSITGRSGLHARLHSGGRGSDSNHTVDARYAAIPEVLANALWDWEDARTASNSITIDFTINEDPGHFSEDVSMVAALGYSSIGGHRVAFGLRTDLDQPGTDGSQGKGIIYNRWGTHDVATNASVPDGAWVETGSLFGDFISIRIPYDWGEGAYTFRLAPQGDDDEDGRWYGLSITEQSTGVTTQLGSLKFPFTESGQAPVIAPRHDVFGSLIAVLGARAIKPHELPVFEIALDRPIMSSGDLPNQVTANYSPLFGVITSANITYDTANDRVVIRAGGRTSRITQAGTVISLPDN